MSSRKNTKGGDDKASLIADAVKKALVASLVLKCKLQEEEVGRVVKMKNYFSHIERAYLLAYNVLVTENINI